MNVKKFIFVTLFVGLVAYSAFTAEYASPSRVGSFRFRNGYTVMYEGWDLRLDVEDGRMDGIYYALAYWSPERLWGARVSNRSVIWINIVDWENNFDPKDKRIDFGEVYKNTLTQQIFDSIEYGKHSVCEAYIKIEIRDGYLTRIWTDDDDWRQFAKKIGW